MVRWGDAAWQGSDSLARGSIPPPPPPPTTTTTTSPIGPATPLLASSFWQNHFKPALDRLGGHCRCKNLRHTSLALALARRISTPRRCRRGWATRRSTSPPTPTPPPSPRYSTHLSHLARSLP